MLKALQDAHDRIPDLGRGELLADADAGTHAEGDIVPRLLGLPANPSVRVECERVGVEIGAPVQVDGGVGNDGVFEDPHRQGPGRAAALR